MTALLEPISRIGIIGSYGGMNLGDEAILAAIVQELRERLPAEITAFTMNPDDTLGRHDVDRAIDPARLSRLELADEISRLDLFILGGGGIIFDGYSRVFLRHAEIAKDCGVPVMTWAVGAGPLTDVAERHFVRDILNQVDLITVRGAQARLILEDVGVTQNIVVTADPALLLVPDPAGDDVLHREGVDPGTRLIGVSIREPGPAAPDLDISHYHQLLANVSDYLSERIEATILFIPMERPTDLQHAHGVISRMVNPQHATVLRGEYTSGQVLGLMHHLEFAVGMRLHFLLFAARTHTPFVPLPYASKVEELVRELGMPLYPIQRTNTGQLLAHIDRAWDERHLLRQRLEHQLPTIIDRARLTADLAVGLVRPRAVEIHDQQPIELGPRDDPSLRTP